MYDVQPILVLRFRHATNEDLNFMGDLARTGAGEAAWKPKGVKLTANMLQRNSKTDNGIVNVSAVVRVAVLADIASHFSSAVCYQRMCPPSPSFNIYSIEFDQAPTQSEKVRQNG
jgi:hypothetical protein